MSRACGSVTTCAPKHERLLRLEKTVRECKLDLNEAQTRRIERFRLEFRERHIVTQYTGPLVAMDTFFVDTLKEGVSAARDRWLLVLRFDEHFRIIGRSKWYESVAEMQKDLDTYLIHYNTKRPHQRRLMNGKTPTEIFVKGLPKTSKKAT